jgi:Helix-loop-helix DNA-binding domain
MSSKRASSRKRKLTVDTKQPHTGVSIHSSPTDSDSSGVPDRSASDGSTKVTKSPRRSRLVVLAAMPSPTRRGFSPRSQHSPMLPPRTNAPSALSLGAGNSSIQPSAYKRLKVDPDAKRRGNMVVQQSPRGLAALAAAIGSPANHIRIPSAAPSPLSSSGSNTPSSGSSRLPSAFQLDWTAVTRAVQSPPARPGSSPLSLLGGLSQLYRLSSAGAAFLTGFASGSSNSNSNSNNNNNGTATSISTANGENHSDVKTSRSSPSSILARSKAFQSPAAPVRARPIAIASAVADTDRLHGDTTVRQAAVARVVPTATAKRLANTSTRSRSSTSRKKGGSADAASSRKSRKNVRERARRSEIKDQLDSLCEMLDIATSRESGSGGASPQKASLIAMVCNAIVEFRAALQSTVIEHCAMIRKAWARPNNLPLVKNVCAIGQTHMKAHLLDVDWKAIDASFSIRVVDMEPDVVVHNDDPALKALWDGAPNADRDGWAQPRRAPKTFEEKKKQRKERKNLREKQRRQRVNALFIIMGRLLLLRSVGSEQKVSILTKVIVHVADLGALAAHTISHMRYALAKIPTAANFSTPALDRLCAMRSCYTTLSSAYVASRVQQSPAYSGLYPGFSTNPKAALWHQCSGLPSDAIIELLRGMVTNDGSVWPVAGSSPSSSPSLVPSSRIESYVKIEDDEDDEDDADEDAEAPTEAANTSSSSSSASAT